MRDLNNTSQQLSFTEKVEPPHPSPDPALDPEGPHVDATAAETPNLRESDEPSGPSFDLGGTLAVLMATGLPLHEALVMTAEGHPDLHLLLPVAVIEEALRSAAIGRVPSPFAYGASRGLPLDDSDYESAMGPFLEGLFHASPELGNWVLTLAGNLRIEWTLRIRGLEILCALPSGWTVCGDLILEACPSLVSLPARLSVERNLGVMKCSLLETLHSDLRVGGDLHFEKCSSLKRITPGIMIGGSIEIEESGLEELPKDLHVGESVFIYRCAAFRSLPEGLVVGDRLMVIQCPAWDGKVPPDAMVQDCIITDEFAGGIPLSKWFLIKGTP